jgi:DNA-binding GntR family transcriptional regulator
MRRAQYLSWGPPPAREPVAVAAYRQLRELILRGQIAPGARINEQELARAWQVSRTPIRDAVRRLEAEGLVATVPGKGTVVPRPSPADTDELYELLEALEGLAARRAAERAAGALLMQLSGVLKTYGTALKQSDYDRLVAAAGDFHGTIARLALNRRLERLIETTRGQLWPVELALVRVKGRAAKSFREFAKVTAAIRAQNPSRAEASMREHLAGLRTDAMALVLSEEAAALP